MSFLAALPIVGSFFKPIFEIIDQAVPDKDLATQLKTRLAESQIMLNLAEAQSHSLFIAGWRPCLGWVGVAGIVYELLLRPITVGVLGIWGIAAPLPSVESALFEIVMGMLGLGAFRSYEKVNGVSGKH